MSNNRLALSRTSGAEGLLYREVGPSDGRSIVFLHGWPEDSSSWSAVMALAADQGFRCLAFDLPGVGGSKIQTPTGRKTELARLVLGALEELGIGPTILVGTDVGGMVAYACLRMNPEALESAVIMNTVIPGLAPWDEVRHNPHIWHFAFHAIPDLPELLVQPNIPLYFGYFYDVISGEIRGIGEEARRHYVESYTDPISLRQGFEFYRSFSLDEKDNTAAQCALETPILYLRGEHEGGDLDDYLKGFWAAGINKAEASRVKGAGHFCPDEQPANTWLEISRFIDERLPRGAEKRNQA